MKMPSGTFVLFLWTIALRKMRIYIISNKRKERSCDEYIKIPKIVMYNVVILNVELLLARKCFVLGDLIHNLLFFKGIFGDVIVYFYVIRIQLRCKLLRPCNYKGLVKFSKLGECSSPF